MTALPYITFSNSGVGRRVVASFGLQFRFGKVYLLRRILAADVPEILLDLGQSILCVDVANDRQNRIVGRVICAEEDKSAASYPEFVRPNLD